MSEVTHIGNDCKRNHGGERYKDGSCRRCMLLNWNQRRSAAPLWDMLRQAKVRAKRKGIEFDIEESDIELPIICPLLGLPLRYGGMGLSQSNSATLDRIDNLKGYVKGNVWVISFRANTIKSDASLSELSLLVGNLLKKRNV